MLSFCFPEISFRAFIVYNFKLTFFPKNAFEVASNMKQI